jgi:hypothetical protein
MRWGFLLAVALLGLARVAAAADETAAGLPRPSAELLRPRARTPKPASLHPPIILRDATGMAVVESGGPASAERTCDGCHDVAWISAHSYHSQIGFDERKARGRTPSGRAWDFSPGLFGRWDPLDYTVAPVPGDANFVSRLATWEKQEGGRHVGGGPTAELAGENCFLCHLREADNQARVGWLARGVFAWADTATLAAAGLATEDGERWQWHKERFGPGGVIPAAALGLGRPTDRACGFCHGEVVQQTAPLTLTRDPQQRMTETQGLVFSPQRISDSAVNLAGKDALVRPWDVHAERMVSCSSCHFSPNHPAYSFAGRGPEHLQFDARRTEITEYLRRPDHQLAKGQSTQGTVANAHDGTMRRCEDCHDAPKAHRWLPRAERHFSAMLCESCHVPMAYAPARQETDWTLLNAEHEARVVYRGVRDDGFVTGFRPVLLPRVQADGTRKLVPNNLVTTWFWIEKTAEGRRPVAKDTLDRALFADGAYRPELVRALDQNGDGRLQDSELVLDTEAKVGVGRHLLIAAGAMDPVITGEIQPYGLHHGVSPGRFATRECSSCHTRDSRLDEPFVLASAAPFGVTPALVGDANLLLPGGILPDARGRLVLQPMLAGVHVFGHSRNRLIDMLGILLLAGSMAGAAGHALLRVRSARRRSKERS